LSPTRPIASDKAGRRLAALVVTEINPDHDPEGLLVRQFVDAFVDALRPVAASLH
jgi:hypothetical protein